MNFPIRVKLCLAIGLPLLVVHGLTIWWEYRVTSSRALANMKERLTELVVRQTVQLDGDLRVARQAAGGAAMFISRNPGLSAEQVESILQAELCHNDSLFGMCAAFEPGRFRPDAEVYSPYYCRAMDGGLARIDIAESRPDYRTLNWYEPSRASGRAVWSEPYYDEGVSNRWMCTYSAPIVRDDTFQGLVTVDLLSADLLQEIRQTHWGSGYCFLISRRGAFISHPDETLPMRETIFSVAERTGDTKLDEIGQRMTRGETGCERLADYRTGEPKWIVFAPVSSTGWSLAAVVPEREVLAPVHSWIQWFIGTLVFGLLIGVAIIWLASGWITRPLVALAGAADRLGGGDLRAKAPEPRGTDEVARLAQRFNSMVDSLRLNIEARLRDEAKHHAVEGELRAAREIQTSLLPGPLPDTSRYGFDLRTVNVPAKTVAGDFFDHFFIDAHRMALVMADVSGKGVPAAVYMAVARTTLRDCTAADKSPSQVITEVNRRLAQDNENAMFVTLFFAYYDTRQGELVYVNAGHCPPYVARVSGGLELLEPTGPLVAPFPNATFRDATCHLAPGDTLFLFTDGVTEASGGDTSELFGEERLEAVLRECAEAAPDDLCRRVIESVARFSDEEFKDDVTLLALKRRTPTESLSVS